jgi:gamma-glutamylcyclotransferase (GGCT)/AIG2-like uncharacterized protein YtfP
MRRMLYSAYGADLDPTQMRQRCPQARYVNKARLDGYALCFPRWSHIRASAVASLEPAADEAVWGVLYEIDETDLVRLDERQGYDRRRALADNPFVRARITVVLPSGKKVDADTYVATPSAQPRLPSSEYIRYLVQLAEACDLPRDYWRKLRAVETEPLAA